MPKIDTIFFWLGGVITESIPEAIARVLYGVSLAKVPIDDRLRLRELAEQLYLGQISGLSFCQGIVEQSNKPYEPAPLEAEIQATVPQYPEVLDVIDELPANYERWLLSDFPLDWTRVIGNRLDLSRYFSEGRRLHTTTSRLKQLVPDVFDTMTRQAGKPLSNCLMIDANSARAVQGVRHGLHSTIYVDARRLRREFVMRRMLPKPPGYVMPGPRNMR